VPRSARPISAWLLQATLACVTLVMLVGRWRMGWMVALNFDRVR
jgi:hypothetical protein